MSFSEKLVNVVQVSVLTVISVVTFITVTGATVYGGSRAVDWTFGLDKHTSIRWLGNHATPIAEGARAVANIAIAIGFNGAANK